MTTHPLVKPNITLLRWTIRKVGLTVEVTFFYSDGTAVTFDGRTYRHE